LRSWHLKVLKQARQAESEKEISTFQMHKTRELPHHSHKDCVTFPDVCDTSPAVNTTPVPAASPEAVRPHLTPFCAVDPGLAVDWVYGNAPDPPRSPNPPQSSTGPLYHPPRAPHSHHGCHRDLSRAGDAPALLRRQGLTGLWRHSARSAHLRAEADGYGCGTVHILWCTVPHPPPQASSGPANKRRPRVGGGDEPGSRGPGTGAGRAPARAA
jgi:hypothetical protein